MDTKEKEERFQNHKIKEVSITDDIALFHCRAPDCSNFWFRIIFAKNFICMYGDIGELLLVPYLSGGNRTPWKEAFYWLCNGVKSLGYFIEKIGRYNQIYDDKYVHENAVEAVKYSIDPDNPDDPDIKMLHDLEEFPPDHIQGFYDLWCEHNRGGDGPPEIRNYHGQFPWQVAAIKWFTENYNISEE